MRNWLPERPMRRTNRRSHATHSPQPFRRPGPARTASHFESHFECFDYELFNPPISTRERNLVPARPGQTPHFSTFEAIANISIVDAPLASGSPQGPGQTPTSRHSKPLRIFRLSGPSIPDLNTRRNLVPRRPGQTPTSRHSKPLRMFRLWGSANPISILGGNLVLRRPGQTPTSRHSKPLRMFRLWPARPRSLDVGPRSGSPRR